MNIDILRTDNPEVWQSAHEQVDGAGLFHDPRWAKLWAAVFGEEMQCLIAKVDGVARAMLPLLRRRAGLTHHYWISVPYFDAAGPVGDMSCFPVLLSEARALCRDRRDRWVEIRSHEALDTHWHDVAHKEHVVMELPATEELLYEGFKSKLRSQVRRAERENPVSEVGGASLVSILHDVYSHRMWELGSPCQPRRLFRALVETFPTESAVLLVRLEGEPVAAAFLLQDGDRVVIPWASTLSKVNRLSMNMVLYARALAWAVERGAKWFDFGRSDAGSSQMRFKRQWGGNVRQLHWYRDPAPIGAPSASPRRELAQKLWRQLPLRVTRFLGPRVIPYFS